LRPQSPLKTRTREGSYARALTVDIYVCIYIYRERDGGREKQTGVFAPRPGRVRGRTPTRAHNVDIHIYTEREGEGERKRGREREIWIRLNPSPVYAEL